MQMGNEILPGDGRSTREQLLRLIQGRKDLLILMRTRVEEDQRKQRRFEKI